MIRTISVDDLCNDDQDEDINEDSKLLAPASAPMAKSLIA